MDGAFFGGMMPLPPELREELQRQHERQVMSAESAHMEMRRFFESLSEEQAVTLWKIFAAMTRTDDPMQTFNSASDYGGYMRALIEFKFGKCPCGQDHDLDPSQLMGEAQGDDEGE